MDMAAVNIRLNSSFEIVKKLVRIFQYISKLQYVSHKLLGY